MAYYLCITNNNSNKIIAVPKLENFDRTTRLKGEACSLSEIDNLTTKYKNEVELKRDLYKSGLIAEEDINKVITIRMKNQNVLEKVRYGMFFSESAKYLDQIYLYQTILSKQKDLEFLEKLTMRYRNSYSNCLNITSISQMVQTKKLKSNYRMDEMYEVLKSFIENEMYNIDKKTGEVKIKYRQLHDLGMFVYNYDKVKFIEKNGITKDMLKEERQKELSQLKDELLNEKNIEENTIETIPKYKKRTLKKNKNFIEGQTSLFDNDYKKE